MNNNPAFPEKVKPASNRNKMLIGAGVAVLALLFCLLVVGGLLIVDPFGWQLMDRITGKGDTAVKAMPADTVMYLGVNLLNLTPEKMDRVVAPFQKIVEEQTGEPSATLDDLKKQFDDGVLSDLGMTFAEDIQPWIGQYIGLGLSNLQMGQYGSPEKVDMLVAIEARDRAAADAFLVKLKTKVAENSGSSFVDTEYQGITISTLSSQKESERLSFARSGNLLLFSNQESMLEKSIGSIKSGSLNADPVYKQLIGQLPKDRILGVYISGTKLDELLQASSQSMGGMALGNSYQFLSGLAMSASVVDVGLQVDSMIAYDPAKMDESQKKMLTSTGAVLKLPEALPEGTVLYAGGKNLDLVWLANKAALGQTAGMGSDMDQAMELFAQQYGFNPDTDLFPYLDGEWGFAVMPAETGILAKSMNVSLGGMILAETNNPDKISGVVSGFTASMLAMGFQFEDVTVGSDTLKQSSDPTMGPMITLGLSQGRLVIATSSDVVAAITGSQATLVKAEHYQQALKALPKGINPVIYLDLEKMLGDIRSGLTPEMLSSFEESVNNLKPVQYIIAGSSVVKNNLAHGVLVVFIQPK